MANELKQASDPSTVPTQEPTQLSPLIQAALNGQLEEVRLLLQQGAHVDVPAPPPELGTNRYSPQVKLLLDKADAKADLEITGPGFTALDAACQNGHLDVVKLLLHTRHIDLASDCKPLFAASQNGHLKVVELLLNNGANVDSLNHGFTSLNVAAKNGHLDVVKLLLAREANIDLNTLGFSALYLACCNGHTEVVRLLMAQGANTELATNEEKNTPLVCAALNGHLESARLLLDGGVNVNLGEIHNRAPLYQAACRGHLQVATLLLERGASINQPDVEGFTPLLVATQGGYVEAVKYLLESGAIDDFVDVDGDSPLMLASAEGHLELVKLFLDRGKYVNFASSKFGNTPLINAATEGHLEIVKLLLDRGANINQPNKARVSPLIRASRFGQLEVVQLLLQRGAAVNHLDKNWGSALTMACQSGHVKVVKQLAEAGANIELKDDDGYPPLALACHNGFLDVVECLVELGASTAILPISGQSPLQIAAEQQSFDVVKFLVERFPTWDKYARISALKESLQANRFEICEILLRNCPQLAVEEPTAVHLAAQSEDPRSLTILSLLIDLGADVNWIAKESGIEQTALHVAVKHKQAGKIWQLVLNGAYTTIPHIQREVSKTVWQLWDHYADKSTFDALLHFWTPQTHHLHPKCVRRAITIVLMIAKRQQWPLDRLVLLKIVSFIAYDWGKKPQEENATLSLHKRKFNS